MWKIPLFDLNYDQREEAAVLAVLRSRWLTMGLRTQQFEEAFAAMLGHDRKCLALSSCTAALHLSLLAADIGPGDEVVISGLSFVAALNVVSLVGATPVLADCVSLDDWNIDPDDIAAKITPRTKALIVVHFAGYPCNMDRLMAIAAQHKLLVIEDVAHAIGASWKGKQCGSFGDLACFSFFSNKNLSVGEGGMIATSRTDLDDRLRLLRSHGMTSLTIDRHSGRSISYDVLLPGLNYRMDEIRAALGLVQLEKLPEANRLRQERAKWYRKALQKQQKIIVPWEHESSYSASSYHIFPVLLPRQADRRQVMERLRVEGIQTSLHYPAYGQFSTYQGQFESLPVADEISARVLTLPLYPGMTETMVVDVCEQLHQAIS